LTLAAVVAQLYDSIHRGRSIVNFFSFVTIQSNFWRSSCWGRRLGRGARLLERFVPPHRRHVANLSPHVLRRIDGSRRHHGLVSLPVSSPGESLAGVMTTILAIALSDALLGALIVWYSRLRSAGHV
jgi:hypothetical protein